MGFKNIYDTLEQYFVYRTAAVEGASGAALERTFTVLETLEETLEETLHGELDYLPVLQRVP